MLTKFICLCCNIGCNVSRYLPDVWEGRIDEPLFKVLFWDLLSKSLRCCRMYDESKLVNPAYISKKALSVHWTQSGPWIQFETQCERTPQFCDCVRDLQAGGENNIAKGEKKRYHRNASLLYSASSLVVLSSKRYTHEQNYGKHSGSSTYRVRSTYRLLEACHREHELPQTSPNQGQTLGRYRHCLPAEATVYI